MPWFGTPDAVRIFYRESQVPRAKAAVQLSHGVSEHSGRYLELIEALNVAGYSVWADDHLGHGLTGMNQYDGDREKLGLLGPGGMQAAIAEVHQLSEIIRQVVPTLPLIYLGHSWGSLMGQIILNRWSEDYDGFILSGSAYRVLGSMNAGDLNKRHAHLGSTPVEWLSRDPAVAPEFMADPLTGLHPARKVFGITGGLQLLGRPRRNLPHDLPLLIMVGDDDNLGGEPSNRRLARAYQRRSGLSDVTLKVYPGARHELFNEVNRAEVRAFTVAWLDAHFPNR